MQSIIEEIKKDNLTEVKKLLIEGMEKDFYKGFNLLHWASLHNASKCAKYLISIGLDVDSRTNGIERTLSHPNRNDFIIKDLLDLHPEVKDFIGSSPLIIASEKGNVEVAKILIDNNADINYKDNDDNTPLMRASYRGNIKIIKLILKQDNISINSFDIDRWTALMFAAAKGNPEIVSILITHGADINSIDKSRSNALMKSSSYNHLKISELLINEGADIDLKDNAGWSSLLKASMYSFEVLNLLIKNNADVNASSNSGFTPLMNACRYGEEKIIKTLIKSGADLNLLDDNDRNAYYWAILNRHKKIGEILLEYGSKKIIIDKHGVNLSEII